MVQRSKHIIVSEQKDNGLDLLKSNLNGKSYFYSLRSIQTETGISNGVEKGKLQNIYMHFA